MSSEENIEPTATTNVDDSPTEPEAPPEVSRKILAGSFEVEKIKYIKEEEKTLR